MAHVEDRWKGERPSGSGKRWRVRYVDADQRQRARSFEKKVDAERFAVTVAADVLRGSYVDPAVGRESLRLYANDWLARRIDLRPATRDLYWVHLDRHVLPVLGSTALAAITPSDVRTAVRVWSSELAPSTVVGIQGAVSGAPLCGR